MIHCFNFIAIHVELTMKVKLSYIIIAILLVCCFALFSAYNTIQSEDESVSASWSEVLSQYQRRADLIPNLVNTVKGYTDNEKALLTEITEARAKVGSIQINAEQLSDRALFEQFQKAQANLGSALSRLIAVNENYPDLKSSPLYQDLMTQLEGTENRITVARGRYIDSIRSYNSHIRKFPAKLIADYLGLQTKLQFTVENEKQISTPPVVNFGQ